jgi:hypothetical protein
VSTWLNHKVPRYFVKHTSKYFCEVVLDKLNKVKQIDTSSISWRAQENKRLTLPWKKEFLLPVCLSDRTSVFSCLWARTGTSPLPGSPVCQAADSQAFGLELESHHLESPTCQLQILELISLQNPMNQFYVIIYLCRYTHTYPIGSCSLETPANTDLLSSQVGMRMRLLETRKNWVVF